jgi:hypothetical protein
MEDTMPDESQLDHDDGREAQVKTSAEKKIVRYIAIAIVGAVLSVLAVVVPQLPGGGLPWNELILHIGGGLMVAGFLSVIFTWITWGAGSRPIEIYEKSENWVFDKLARKARRDIWISGISLSPRLSRFCNEDEFNSLKKTVKIRLLFCHPDSDYAKKRALSEKYHLDKMKFDIWLSIAKACIAVKKFNAAHNAPCSNLEIGVITDDLPATIFLSDNVIVYGHFLPGIQASQTYRIKLEEKGPGQSDLVYAQLKNAFLELWNQSKVFVTTIYQPEARAVFQHTRSEFWVNFGQPMIANNNDFTQIDAVKNVLSQPAMWSISQGDKDIFKAASDYLNTILKP